jgi:hypothetical protein
VLQGQAGSPHPDPVHLNAQFLKPIAVSEVEVQIKKIRKGNQFTNLTANIVQNVSKSDA